MADKKPKGGRHKTPRQPVQMPKDWLALARTLARRERPVPTLWYLIGLIEADAKKHGVKTIPPYPWDDPRT